MELKAHIQKKIAESDCKTILVHSDIMKGFGIKFLSKETFLSTHLEELLSLDPNRHIWMPVFNYDFCKGIEHNVKDTPSKVGVLTEYFRKNDAEWRSAVPVFSFAGNGDAPELDLTGLIDPFGEKSAFDILYQSGSLLMHYGSLISSSTILHYAERISGKLCYRYDKHFKGNILITDDERISGVLNFHVRPLGKHLDYDWEKIENDLIVNNILVVFNEGNARILLCKVKDIVDFWVNKIQHDPFYLLDKLSKAWVKPLLDQLGRKFIITDFETI